MTGLVAALAMAAPLGLMFRIEAEMEQGIVVLGGHQHHAPATAAVTAAGSAARDELFTPRRQATVAAVAGFDGNDDFVYKLHGMDHRDRRMIPLWILGHGEMRYSAATMLTNLPMRPRSRNSMTPVTLANSVSSLPMPTLVPGLIL